MTLPIIEISKIKEPLTPGKRILIAIISLVIGGIIFAISYISIKQNIMVETFNQPFLSWIINHRYADLTSIAKIIAIVAKPTYLFIAVIVASIIWAIANREIWRPLLFTVAMGITGMVSTFLKDYVMFARPDQANMISPFETDFSFPSGHTISIIVALLVLGYLIYSRHFSGGRFCLWIVVTFFITAIVALSRLYLGYHWITDVTASIGLGLIILSIIVFIDAIITKIFQRLE